MEGYRRFNSTVFYNCSQKRNESFLMGLLKILRGLIKMFQLQTRRSIFCKRFEAINPQIARVGKNLSVSFLQAVKGVIQLVRRVVNV